MTHEESFRERKGEIYWSLVASLFGSSALGIWGSSMESLAKDTRGALSGEGDRGSVGGGNIPYPDGQKSTRHALRQPRFMTTLSCGTRYEDLLKE